MLLDIIIFRMLCLQIGACVINAYSTLYCSNFSFWLRAVVDLN